MENENQSAKLSELNAGLGEYQCAGYCADLGCDKTVIATDADPLVRRFCAKCSARVVSNIRFFNFVVPNAEIRGGVAVPLD